MVIIALFSHVIIKLLCKFKKDEIVTGLLTLWSSPTHISHFYMVYGGIFHRCYFQEG